MNTTLLDLHKTAITAAMGNVTADKLTTEQNRITQFEAAGYDKKDYDSFERVHDDYLTKFRTLANQPSPATVIARNASAQAKTVAAPATAPATVSVSPAK